MNFPNFDFELHYKAEGRNHIAGLDEVGMGCLAGPVVAAAVILNPDHIPLGLNDSKLISAKKREHLVKDIEELAQAVAIGWASVEEIDSINIFQAARLAMKRAVLGLKIVPDFLLIDGRTSVEMAIEQTAIIKGDQKSVSIAAASIIAKVYRDDWMQRLDEEFPGFELAKHKGYGSRTHRLHLMRLGPSPIHRKSFHWTPVA